jgi:hypothetical protein
LERIIVIRVKPNAPKILAVPNRPGIRYKMETMIPIPKIIKPSETIKPTIGE